MLEQVSGSGTVHVPLYGHILCAGFPSPAQDHIEEHVEMPRWMAPNPAFTFLFKVGGYSMIKARIFPGDLLVARHRPAKGGHPNLRRHRPDQDPGEARQPHRQEYPGARRLLRSDG